MINVCLCYLSLEYAMGEYNELLRDIKDNSTRHALYHVHVQTHITSISSHIKRNRWHSIWCLLSICLVFCLFVLPHTHRDRCQREATKIGVSKVCCVCVNSLESIVRRNTVRTAYTRNSTKTYYSCSFGSCANHNAICDLWINKMPSIWIGCQE